MRGVAVRLCMVDHRHHRAMIIAPLRDLDPRRLPCRRIAAFGNDHQRRAEQAAAVQQIGRAHVRTPVTNAQLVSRLLAEKKKVETSFLRSEAHTSELPTLMSIQ